MLKRERFIDARGFFSGGMKNLPLARRICPN
jgi:hypothetical protein